MSFSIPITSISGLPDAQGLQYGDVIPIMRGGAVMKAYYGAQGISLYPAVDIVAGQALCINSSGLLIPAKADELDTAYVIGIASANVTVASALPVIFSQGSNSSQAALSVGQPCYLSAVTPGLITSSQPASGNYLVYAGIGITTSSLAINIYQPSLIP